MKLNKKIIITLFIIIFMFFISNSVEASYSASNQTVDSGKSVSITIRSTEKLESFDVECTDIGGLTYNSCSSINGAVVNSAGKKISYAAIGGEATTLGTYKFTAPKVTEQTNYTVKFDVNGETVSSTITVKPEKITETNPVDTTKKDTTTTDKDTTTTEQPKEKSNNAYLKTLGVRITNSLAKELGIKTNEYDFTGFSKTKTSYNVTVPKNVNSLIVVATAADSNATVKISGNSGLEVGTNNKITIKVTAEDGKTTKTYTIKVTKLAEEEEKPGNLIEDEEGLFLTSLSLEGVELSPEFVKDTYSYTAILEDSSISELKVTAEANKEKAKIEISGNTNLVEGENTINLLVTLDDSDIKTVYQIVVTKTVAPVNNSSDADTNTTNNESSTIDIIGMFKGYVGIAILIVVLMIVAVIVLIILLRKENRRIKEEAEDYEEDINTKSEEYNVYNNDENEFVNNEIKKDNFIESLYKQRNGDFTEEDLTETEKETLEEISKQTEEIFTEKVEGQSVEYTTEELYEENPLEVRKRRRGKGKHSL